jgi:hypothetical protein
MVGVPVAIQQALRLKAMGTVIVRFSNTPITSHGTRGRSRFGAAMGIILSESIPWAQRASVTTDAGVYVITKAGDGVYIGKSWGGDGLRGRLTAFHRSATTGERGHAGGVTFHNSFGAICADEISVAVHVPFTIRRDAEILYPYLLYVERRLIWEHVERYGRMPACNRW